MSNLEAVHQHSREQFELARKLYERPRIAPTDIKPEVSLTDRAAPIFRIIMTAPTEHRRRDCVSYEIVVPNVDNLDELFAEALASLGFEQEAAQ
jgi:hypothetical protein